LSGCGYDWAEEVAERLRQEAVNALLLLAELTESDDPATALSALTTAITLNPDGEQLYYNAIRIYVNNDNRHSAAQLYRQLEHRLSELDAEPEYSAGELIPRARLESRNSADTSVRQDHRQPHRQAHRHPTVLKGGTSTGTHDAIKPQLRPDIDEA